MRVVDELVEDALRELADPEAQARLWRAAEGAEVSSLIECTSRLWDDSGLATALERGVVYGEPIDSQLSRLRAVLHRIDATAPVDALLENPRLSEARTLARVLLEELNEFGHERGSS